MKSENYSIKDRLAELVERYEEFVQFGPYSGEYHTCEPEQIDSILPEDFSCGKDVENALERAWFRFSGEYELIPVIVDKVKSMIRKASYEPVAFDGQYSFIFGNGELRVSNVA